MKFNPLYSRTSTGAIQVWQIEVVPSEGKFRTISGQIDGKKTMSEWSVCLGKNIGKSNETSPEEQAIAEAKAKYAKQLKEGYFENIDDIDEQLYFSPQLAHKWEDYKDDIDWSNGVYISFKLDGLRSVITKTGAASRNGRKFISFPHILKTLQPLFDKYPNLILDGEIYTHKLKSDFNQIISLAKKTKPTAEDLAESEKYLEYWIFDLPSAEGGFHERYQALKKLLDENLPDHKHIKLCPHRLIYSEKEIETHLYDYLNQGFEGLMVNTYNGKYEQKRSKNLLKYKLFQDLECEIVDIIEGTGNRSGMFGYAKLKMPNGIGFDSNARGNEEFYIDLLKNKKQYIGKQATCRFQNLTPDGKPRFPVIVAIRNYE